MIRSSIVIRRVADTSSRVRVIADEPEAFGNSLESRLPYLLRATSLSVTVPQIAEGNLFYSMYYSRWLADLKVAGVATTLPLAGRQSEWLNDYQEFLLVALGEPEALTRTGWCRGSVQRFLCRMGASHDHDIVDFIRRNPIGGLHPAEHEKASNILRLFKSLPRARSLSEGLGLPVVLTPALP